MLIERPVVKNARDGAICIVFVILLISGIACCGHIREVENDYRGFILEVGTAVPVSFILGFIGCLMESGKYDLYLEDDFLIIKRVNTSEELSRIDLRLVVYFEGRPENRFLNRNWCLILSEKPVITNFYTKLFLGRQPLRLDERSGKDYKIGPLTVGDKDIIVDAIMRHLGVRVKLTKRIGRFWTTYV